MVGVLVHSQVQVDHTEMLVALVDLQEVVVHLMESPLQVAVEVTEETTLSILVC